MGILTMKRYLRPWFQSVMSLPTLGVVGSAKLLMTHFVRGTFLIRPRGYEQPIVVRGRTSDPYLVFAILTKSEYPAPDDPDIDLIIDAGANVGYSVVYFAHHYPRARIIAVEPELANYQVLCANIVGLPQVTTFNQALWWRRAQVRLANPEAQSMGYRFEEAGPEGTPSLTLSEIIGTHAGEGKILVKMDIEGAERAIFERDSAWLARVDYLFIEIHDCWQQVFRALYPYDYRARLSGENLIVTLRRP